MFYYLCSLNRFKKSVLNLALKRIGNNFLVVYFLSPHSPLKDKIAEAGVVRRFYFLF